MDQATLAILVLLISFLVMIFLRFPIAYAVRFCTCLYRDFPLQQYVSKW